MAKRTINTEASLTKKGLDFSHHPCRTRHRIYWLYHTIDLSPLFKDGM